MKTLLALLLMTSTAAAQQPFRIVEGRFASPAGARAYRLALPPGHAPARPAPLLVMLHGCLQDAADVARGTRLDAQATAQGFVVLYPEQPEAANPRRCWNWFDPVHQARDAGEPAILAGMIAHVVEEQGTDPARTYVAGISAGGAMAVILAASYPEMFAGVASASGIALGAASSVMGALAAMAGNAPSPPPVAPRMLPRRALPMPLLVMQGMRDKSVSPRNAHQLLEQWLGQALPAPASTEQGTVAAAGGYHWRHDRLPATGTTPRVEALWVEELGHAWSGGSPDGSFTDPLGPDATAVMLRFFASVGEAR